MGLNNGRLSTLTYESYDLVTNTDLSAIEIVVTSGGENCYIRTIDKNHYYDSFILSQNRRTIVLCKVSFYPSSITGKYIPRLIFKKNNITGSEQIADEKTPVNINLADSDVVERFWRMINFLNSFKEIVDTGEFQRKFAVVSADYAKLVSGLKSPEKVKAITDLIRKGDFSVDDVKSIVFESRKRIIKLFLWLIKNNTISTNGRSTREWYQEKYKLRDASESVWHHFLKNNDWILGICADLRFIKDFIDEAIIGMDDTNGSGSPKVDMIGISNYTTLVELKTSDTKIFKSTKGCKSRANTWEFTSDFISGVSQCLGQKAVFDETYVSKQVVDTDGSIIPKDVVLNRDVKSIFIVGCRNDEFPHNRNADNILKSNTFELFRRNNRNIDIITYDELFERSYHIVFSDKITDNWFSDEKFDIKTHPNE